MTTPLTDAWALFESGDPQGAMRALRSAADTLAPAEIAPLVGRLAETAGFTDLVEASAALHAEPERARELYEFGYACVGRGLPALAEPALRRALRLALAGGKRRLLGRGGAIPPRQIVVELAVALEDRTRHAEAVRVLQEHSALTADWPDHYLLAYNAVMAGQIDLAERVFGALPDADDRWRPAADRLRRTLARTAAARPADDTDLRGWHFALTGGLLATLSPYGFTQSMTGRWAYLQDSYDSCRHGLERLRAVLAATGREPSAVGLLPDRGSQALGLAAARLLGVPAAPYREGAPDTLVVAYDLADCDEELVGGLRERAPGEILYEHATCWTDPPAVSADVSGLLVQRVVAPWGSRMAAGADGELRQSAEDGRTAGELAEVITAAAGAPDEGDGQTPADGDEVLAGFAARVRDVWLTGSRDRVRSPGPVRSASFG